MSDQELEAALEAPFEEEPPKQEQQQEEQAAPWTPDDEQFARQWGWKPKEEYHGDDGRWEPADQFAQKIKGRWSTVEKLERQNQDLERRLSERDATVRQEIDGVRRMLQAGYDRREQALRQVMEQSVEDADKERFQTAQRALDDLQKERQEATPQQSAPGQSPQDAEIERVATQFKATNSDWLNMPGELNEAASDYVVARSNRLARMGYSPEQQMHAIQKEVGERFGLGPMAKKPEPQPKPAPRVPARGAVDGGGASHAQRLVNGKMKKGFKDMPIDAQLEFNRGVSTGLYQDNDEERQFVADHYFAEGA